MVALHQPFEVPEDKSAVAAIRAEVEHRRAGFSKALMATQPDVLRSIATRAAQAQTAADRWRQRVGERPEFSPERAETAVEAKALCDAGRRARDGALDQCVRILVRGNALALGTVGVAGALVFLGTSPMDLPVAVGVVAAPIAPIVAGWMAARRASAATRHRDSTRKAWIDALEATGLTTMGDLAARRLAVAAWERREIEAVAASEGARPQVRAWQRLAGPGVAPADVEEVIGRLEALRRAQIQLLGALLDERVDKMAMTVLAPEAEVIEPNAAPGWLEEALNRLRGTKLRLWSA